MPVTSARRPGPALPGGTGIAGVFAPQVVAAGAHVVVRHLAGLHPVAHLLQLGRAVLAERAAPLPRPARDRARVVLVEVAEARRIGQVVEARLLGALDGEAGDQLPEGRLAALGARRHLVGRKDEDELLVIATAAVAAVL